MVEGDRRDVALAERLEQELGERFDIGTLVVVQAMKPVCAGRGIDHDQHGSIVNDRGDLDVGRGRPRRDVEQALKVVIRGA